MTEDKPPTPPDQEPGFWAEYAPPASDVARAIQYPMPSCPWAERVVNAYAADARKARRTAAIKGA